MAELLNCMGAGGLAVVLLSVFIEITPISINPVQWLGERFNQGMKTEIKMVSNKLDEHIAQSYRNKILAFQNEILQNKPHTREEFDEVIDACDAYEQYVRDNDLKNGKANAAISYIRRTHRRCLDEHDFLDLPSA